MLKIAHRFLVVLLYLRMTNMTKQEYINRFQDFLHRQYINDRELGYPNDFEEWVNAQAILSLLNLTAEFCMELEKEK